MDDMISARQYAQEKNMEVDTVRNWCAKGRLPGVIQVPRGPNSYAYLIPRTAEPVKPLRKYEKRIIRAAEEPVQMPEVRQQMPEKTVRKLKTMREKAEFIRRNCRNLSYGKLKQETGLSHMEIRRIYDRLHEVHGI